MGSRRIYAATALIALLSACDTSAPPAGSRPVDGETPATPESAEAQLARTRGCFVCHAAGGRKGSAPAFADIAQRHAGDAGAQARLAAKLRTGGGGAWGPIPMPPQPQLTDDDARRLVRWILILPHPGGGDPQAGQIDKPAAQSRQ